MSDNDETLQIDVAELAARRSESDLVLLDVREPWEAAICKLDDSVLIPLAQLPERSEELDKNRRIVVYCHFGGRSLQATRWLRSHGFAKAVNLAGGIHAWSQQIDSSMPTY